LDGINTAIKSIAGITFTLWFCSASAGPFGLEEGMTLKQIGGNPQQVAPGRYRLSSVPKPHSAFESYFVEVGPRTGLCWIQAVGRNVSTSVFGAELHAAFTNLKIKLDQSYGEAKLYDLLLPGSIWNEPQDWMMGLVKKERHLLVAWDKDSGATLPDGIADVTLGAMPIDTETGYLAVEYSFSNLTACDAELSKAEDGAL
jgi:hypothetical protein